MTRPRILLLSPDRSTFVIRDIELLSEKYDVESRFVYRSLRGLTGIAATVGRYDLVFSWVGSYHALAAEIGRLFYRVPSIVVCAGFEAAREPTLDYGMTLHQPKAGAGRWLFGRASKVVTVSEHNHRGTLENLRTDPARTLLIRHGFPLPEEPPMAGKIPFFLNVGLITPTVWYVKGFDLFFEAARRMPDCRFVLVGPDPGGCLPRLGAPWPGNLEHLGPRYGEEIRAIYRQARVYVQLSRNESFGCAAAEAMLHGAIPVLSRRAALPEVGGDTAFYGDPEDMASIVAALGQALAAGPERGLAARERIARLYSLEARRASLHRLVDALLDGEPTESGIPPLP